MSIDLLENSAINCIGMSYASATKDLLLLQSYDSYSNYFRSSERDYASVLKSISFRENLPINIFEEYSIFLEALSEESEEEVSSANNLAVIERLEEIAQINAKLNAKRVEEEKYLEEHTYLSYQSPLPLLEAALSQDVVHSSMEVKPKSTKLTDNTVINSVTKIPKLSSTSDDSSEDWSDVQVSSSQQSVQHVSHISDSDEEWNDAEPAKLTVDKPDVKSDDDDWEAAKPVQPTESNKNDSVNSGNSNPTILPPSSSLRARRMNRRKANKVGDKKAVVKPVISKPNSLNKKSIDSDDDWDDVKPVEAKSLSSSLNPKQTASTIDSDDWDDVKPVQSKPSIPAVNRNQIPQKQDSDDDWDDVKPAKLVANSSNVKEEDDWDVVKPNKSESTSKVKSDSDDDWDDVKPVISAPTTSAVKLNQATSAGDSDDDWEKAKAVESKPNPPVDESDDDWDDVKPAKSNANPKPSKVEQEDDWGDVKPNDATTAITGSLFDDWEDVKPVEAKTNSSSKVIDGEMQLKQRPLDLSFDDWDDVKQDSTANAGSLFDDWEDVKPSESKSDTRKEKQVDDKDSNPTILPPSSSLRARRMNRRKANKVGDKKAVVKPVISKPIISKPNSLNNKSIDSDDDWDDVKPTQSKSSTPAVNRNQIPQKQDSEDDWDDVKPVQSKSNPPKTDSDDDWDNAKVPKSSNTKNTSDDDWDDIEPAKVVANSSNVKEEDDWDVVKPNKSESTSKVKSDSDDDWDDVKPVHSKPSKVEVDDWDDVKPTQSQTNSSLFDSDDDWDIKKAPSASTRRRPIKQHPVDTKVRRRSRLEKPAPIQKQVKPAVVDSWSDDEPDTRMSKSRDVADAKLPPSRSKNIDSAVAYALASMPDFDFLSSSAHGGLF